MQTMQNLLNGLKMSFMMFWNSLGASCLYIWHFSLVLFKVPWIVKWSYQIKDNILIRNHVVKWWDNYDRDRIIKFVYDEFPEIKQVENQPSIPDLLKGKSLEELAEICKFAAQACQAASASASGTGKSPASSEGSTTEMINLSQFSTPMKKNWYEESLFQDA